MSKQCKSLRRVQSNSFVSSIDSADGNLVVLHIGDCQILIEDPTVGKVIKRVRVERDMSLSDLSRRVNIPSPVIEKIERGVAPLPLAQRTRLESVLKMDLSYFNQ